MNSELKPKIRFKGFTDDWEQRKLNEITDVRDGTHDSPKYIEYGHPFITSKNIKNGFIDYSDIQYISDADFKEINKRSKVDINDILFGMIGTIGNIALIRENPTFAIKNVALVKDIHKINYLYLYQYLQSNNITKQFEENVDGGTQKFIALNKVRELIIDYPQSDEQLKIGDFLEQIDNLITLHQRKCDKLVKLKKSLLEKIFPQNNSVIPEIRFKGFTDDWEQCELRDITNFVTGKPFSNDLISCGKYVVMDMGTVNQEGNRIESKRTNLGRDILKKDDLVMPKDDIGGGLIIGRSAYIPLDNRYVLGDHVYRLRFNNINGYFIHYEINSNSIRGKIMPLVTGSAQLGISSKNIGSIKINIPLISEQVKISSLLDVLDNLITLHQRKHDKLNKIKQSLLNDMFL